MRFSRFVLPVIVASALVACGGKKPEAPKPDLGAGTTPAASSPTAELPKVDSPTPAPAAAANAAPSLDKFKMGRDLGADGSVGTELDRLLASEKVIVSFVVRNPWPESTAKAVWKSLKTSKVVGEETKPLPASGPITFEAKGSSSWERGGYRLELTMTAPGKPNASLGSKEFEVVSKR